MNSRVLIPLILIVSFAACVIGGVYMYRRKQSVKPTVQYRRYPHEHLPSTEWEPKAKLTEVSYKLRDGETLANAARLRYGHQHYYRVIKLSNHIEDESRVEAGTTLSLPDMSNILAEEGFTKVAAAETQLILCSRAKYDKVVDRLWDLRRDATDNYVVPETVRRELLEAADDLQQATENLKASKVGVIRPPLRMIRQLEQSMAGMRELAEGAHADPNGYDIDVVQQSYAFALTYAIIWAREGFK